MGFVTVDERPHIRVSAESFLRWAARSLEELT